MAFLQFDNCLVELSVGFVGLAQQIVEVSPFLLGQCLAGELDGRLRLASLEIKR